MKTRGAALCASFLLGLFPLSQAQSQTADDPVHDLPEGLDPDAALLARISGLFSREDPTSLYQFGVYDEEVEFILDGSWEASFTGSLGMAFSDGAAALSFSPPVFTQSVDMSTWIFIDGRWYFEANFAEGFSKNTVAAGYVGGEDENVKHVRLGNSGIAFPDEYPFIAAGGGKAPGPGISGTFAGKKWKADAVVRWDAVSSEELLLSGMNEAADSWVSAANPVRGKWFILPVTAATGGITVYVEDSKGDFSDSEEGVSWRRLNEAEYSLDGLSGMLELAESASGRVAVEHQQSVSLPALTQFLEQERAWFESVLGDETILARYFPEGADEAAVTKKYLRTISGRTALVLRQKSAFSPFEILSRYDTGGEEAEPVWKESGIAAKEWITQIIESEWTALLPAEGISSPRDQQARYPLLAGKEALWIPEIYLSALGGGKAETDLSLRARKWQAIETISLGEDAIAGTVQVYRNGIRSADFTLDDATGILSLGQPPQTGETIRITWKKTDASARNGTLTAAGGIAWTPVPELNLHAALGLIWNLSGASWTDSANDSPGTLTAAAGGTWTKGNLELSSDFAWQVSVPDTTGVYRIDGMETTPTTLYPDSSWYAPIAANLLPDISEAHNAETTPVLTLDGRVEPSSGGTILPRTESGVSGFILPIAATISAGEWTGADILAGDETGLTFAEAASVSVALKNNGSSAPPEYDLWIQLGAARKQSDELPPYIRTWKIPASELPSGGSGWKIITIQLDDEDRSLLASAGNIRLLATPTDGIGAFDSAKVSLLSGPLELGKTGYSARAFPSIEDASNIRLEESTGSEADTLVKQFDMPSRFNAGGRNSVLKLFFSPEPDTESLSISRTTSLMPLHSYEKLMFHVFPVDTGEDSQSPEGLPDDAMLALSLEGRSADTGAAVVVGRLEVRANSLKTGVWQELAANMTTGEVSLDGTVLPGAQARFSYANQQVSPNRIIISLEGWPDALTSTGEDAAYELLLDELYLSGVQSITALRNRSSAEWKKDGPVIGSGSRALMANPSFSGVFESVAVPGESQTTASGSLKSGVSVLGAALEGGIAAASTTEGAISSAWHGIAVPLAFIDAKERFSVDFAGESVERLNEVSVQGPVPLKMIGSVSRSSVKETSSVSASSAPSIRLPGNAALGFFAETKLSQTNSADFDSGRDWFGFWRSSGESFLSEGEESALKRKENASFKAELSRQKGDQGKFSFAGASVKAEGISEYAASSGREAAGKLSIAIPVSIGYSSLEFILARSYALSTSGYTGGNYYSDADNLKEALNSGGWFFAYYPFIDLFDETLYAEALRKSETPAVLVSLYQAVWKRPSPGLLQDLFLPSSLTAETGRTVKADPVSQTGSDIRNASVRMGFSALNMAGTAGIVPLFDWYEQDEISQLYSASFEWGSGFKTWNLDAWHSVTVLFPLTGSAAAENSFHYNTPDISGKDESIRNTTRMIWKRPGKKSFPGSLLEKYLKRKIPASRENTLSGTWERTEGSSDIQDSLRVEATHLLALHMSAKAQARLSGSFAVDRDDEETVLMLSLGIGGKITF